MEFVSRRMAVVQGILLFLGYSTALALPSASDNDSSSNNCTTPNGTFEAIGSRVADELLPEVSPEVSPVAMADATSLLDVPQNSTNMSHLRTFTVPNDWDQRFRPKLNFPKTAGEDRFKMATLHLNKGFFIFDFLRGLLRFVQPYDVPNDLLKDVIDSRITTSKFLSETMHVEAALLALVGVCCVLACIIPGTELWLACRPIREDYKPSQHPGALGFLLTVFVFIFTCCMITMIVCNEAVSSGVEKIPSTVETALQDLNDYHVGRTAHLRKCLTRSLDVASEAVLADLDNVEELLGKPVQEELAAETGLDVALDTLFDVANATQELSSKAISLLKDGERADEVCTQLSREIEDIRRELENSLSSCTGQDRPLCAVIDPSGLRLALRMDRLLRDDHLLRLRNIKQENLTEAGRQARGEYVYVPHHISRSTLDIRNQIRREMNGARARISDEARNIEASSTEFSKQLESARKVADYAIPYIVQFENIRWLVGLGTVLIILPVWSLLFGALCCRCGSSEEKVRPTLLCGVLMSCLVSIGLWAVFVAALTVSSHTDMLLCRPLNDPEYRTIEAILETRVFLGKRLTVPLKDLFEKCRNNEAAYPTFRMGDTMKLEQLTAHWTWLGLTRAIAKLRVDLKGLRILTPNLQQSLQSILYACGSNLTEHRIIIQGPILMKDLNAFSDQLENVARQLSDRGMAREFQLMESRMRGLTSRRVKPLMKLQDELVYRLAVLELQLQPLQRQVNQSLSHLKTIQYYIDNQGEKIAQMKTKTYVERFEGYLDQWRAYVLSEMDNGVSKCRPLWDIVEGLRFLFCQHILGPLNGYWFATLLCVMVMIASTPSAHVLSLVYRREKVLKKESALLPQRSESPDTVVIDRETWQTPDPPPLPDDSSW